MDSCIVASWFAFSRPEQGFRAPLTGGASRPVQGRRRPPTYHLT
jgi:hypothetical protein